MGIKDLTTSEILEEIAKAVAPPTEPPEEAFTYEDIMVWKSMSHKQAEEWMKKCVEKGVVKRLPQWKGRAYFLWITQ